MLSKTAEYALRAALHLAEREEGGPVRAAEAAQALDIPANYLSKILDALRRAGLVTALRGPKGGFELARPSGDVRLIEIVDPFDDIEGRKECLLGKGDCSDEDACAAHHRWKRVSAVYLTFFRNTTLEDLKHPPS